MASDVEICNRALQKLGAKRISSLDDDSTNARACNALYIPLRQAELEKHFWNFAIERHELAADATEPEWGRANSFTLPTGFIKLAPEYPEDTTNAKDWQIEGRKILSDLSDPIYIRCVVDVDDPSQMPPLFREALSTIMAVELCEELTQSNTKKDSLKDDYVKIIREAKRSNAIQNQPRTGPEGTWITGRR